MRPKIPEAPSLEGLERRWSERWEADGTYRFDRRRPAAEVFAIDTPPPTVSGALHVGHIFSYTQTDVLARYQQMRSQEVFYPMGWDDNGLPTERRVQNHFGVRCDPGEPYRPGFEPVPRSERDDGGFTPVSRRNFIELCHRLTAIDERAFEELWRFLGLSVDWSMTYATIGERAQRASQRAFLRLLARGLVYQQEAPTLWDVDYRTAVAQAEIEDRVVPGAYYRLRFAGEQGGLEVETTRPELLGACVALVAHPDDPRYRPLFGTEATTPLYGAPVPVLAHRLAAPDKGTGLAMVCTFGDATDVVWWRELKLPLRALIGRDGTLREAPWGEPGWESADPGRAQETHHALAGLRSRAARRRVAELLGAAGGLVGEFCPIEHLVRFYEKGEEPLEILTSRQWFIRTLDHRAEWLARGAELRWHPPHMRARYDAWVEGLASDWCISRQRFFGVPFPLWYPLREDGSPDHAAPLAPAEERLPVDPAVDAPAGYREEQRGRPGGFVADPDVMDTWATSSLTPQIAGGWGENDDLFARVFPMALRPQAHEIIRTWLFSTVVRAHFEHGSLPFREVAISGWVLDPDRKKMSKSKGNVLTPMALLERYGSDAARYWAAGARLGVDAAFDEGQLKIGRRLAVKILNASRFALSHPEQAGEPGEVTRALDRSMLATLAELVKEATRCIEAWDYTGALVATERFFWHFCDNYLELAKSRAYGNHGAEAAGSALGALRVALATLLRLFAPFLPFVTEEVWSWWREGSVHRAPWPQSAELRAAAADGRPLVLAVAAEVLGEVRKAKTAARASLASEVARLVVRDSAERLAALEEARLDLTTAGRVAELRLEAAAEASVEIELAS